VPSATRKLALVAASWLTRVKARFLAALGMTAAFLSDAIPSTVEQKKGRLPKQTPFELNAPAVD
jgi:hypothetical protein